MDVLQIERVIEPAFIIIAWHRVYLIQTLKHYISSPVIERRAVDKITEPVAWIQVHKRSGKQTNTPEEGGKDEK